MPSLASAQGRTFVRRVPQPHELLVAVKLSLNGIEVILGEMVLTRGDPEVNATIQPATGPPPGRNEADFRCMLV